MSRTIHCCAAAISLSIVIGGAVQAHHSGAMFDRSKVVTVQGALIEYVYTNPHPWLRLMVRSDGKDLEWDAEAPSVQTMSRVGLTRSTLKPGDRLTLRLHPLKDGRPGGALIDVTLASGKVISAGGVPPSTRGSTP